MKRSLIITGLIVGVFAFTVLAFAQEPPTSQTTGGVTQREKEIQKQKTLEEKIKKEKPSPEEAASEDLILPDKGPKVLISGIVVKDAMLLSQEEIRKIVSPYEGKELSMQEMQKVADLISDEYRKKGYVTSRAYILPQSLKEDVLTIRVVEGKLGKLEIKGNRYFSTPLLKKKIGIGSTGYFDYSAFQRSLVYINEHPDRVAKAILAPGAKPGTTDITVEVEDQLPFHVGFSYDNWGSRYIGKHRFALVLEHNNLTGHDDQIYIKSQVSEGTRLVSGQARYIYPITRRLELGGHFLYSKLKLGEEFEDLDSEGEAKIFGLFSNYKIIGRENLDVRLNLGFDHKDIKDDLLGVQLSHDEISNLKFGFDVDANDRWGRTVFTAELDAGIPDFLGSMEDVDPDASRVGAGGEFTKGVFNLFRLQPLPFETWLLWKNSFQVSNDTLPASEQFQIGGATSVRGYPPGEFSGDEGVYSALELSVPFYCLSKDINVPFRKEKLYDAFRFVVFWDIGRVSLNDALPGEEEDITLRSAGFGGRLTIVEDLECRVEVGYPLGGKTPSDEDHAHTWVEFHLKI